MIVLLNPFKIILGLFESEKNTPSLLFLKDALETRVLEVGSNDIINLRDIEEDEE